MGCDIHIKAEFKKDGAWQLADDPIVDCRFCDATGINERADPNEPVKVSEYGQDEHGEEIELSRRHLPPKTCYWCRGTKKRADEFYEGRNYDLFAILANVRNGRGFAGCVTGDGFNSMTDDRGIPDDVSAEGRAYLERYGDDGHSHTFMTLQEILEYDWNQVTVKQGVVTPLAYKEWADRGKTGYPISYSGGVSGPNVVMIDQALMEEKLLKGEIVVTDEDIARLKEDGWADMLRTRDPNAISYYTLIQWTIPYSEARDRSGFNGTIDLLKKLAEEKGVTYDNVRLIMYFDN
jgi:hypothetical protein